MDIVVINQWIEPVAKILNFDNFNIDIQGKSNKDDGYLSVIIYINLNGRLRNGTKKEIDLVLKLSKQGDFYREQFFIGTIFEKEIFIYNNAKKTFEDFARKKSANFPEILPKCFFAQKIGTKEGIVMENLKSDGFVICDRKKPMSFDFLKITLEAFAQWHAYSLAYHKNEPEKFKELTAGNVNIFPHWFEKRNMYQCLYDMLDKAKSTTTSSEILTKVDFSLDDIKYFVTDLLYEDPDDHVILHGDSWTNNFMYKLDEKGRPIDIRLIDLACSSLASPVCDISFFIYCCASKDDQNDLEKLLHIYHDHLSECLEQLGCNSEDVFSYDKLMNHWKKYSKFGLIISNWILRFSLCDADEAPDYVEDLAMGKDFIDIFYFTLKNEDYYLERVGSNLVNYVKYAC